MDNPKKDQNLVILLLLTFISFISFLNCPALGYTSQYYTSMALGNINDDPRMDMVILGVNVTDLKDAHNFYRIAYDISNTNSSIVNGVTQPIEIPGNFTVGNNWISLFNGIGSSFALGNINDDPRMDMVIVNEKENGEGYYRIAYDISNTNSSIVNGVTQPINLDSLYPLDMALGNINDDPRMDMVILEPKETENDQNLAYYRIAYDISNTNSSIVNGVTQDIPILGAYTNISTISDIELGNINDDPRMDMVIMGNGIYSIEFPDELPFKAYYRIAYDISNTNSSIVNGVTQPMSIKGSSDPISGHLIGYSLGNINDDPRMDMVILGSHQNDLFYRIAYDISNTNSSIVNGVTQPIIVK